MIDNKSIPGILAGILAGAFWGLVFLAPELTPAFTPLQLSAGRYIAYGLVAAVLVAHAWRRLWACLGWQEWKQLIWLSFAGNIIYYVLLAGAVQLGGVASTSIVIGLLPVLVTLAGSFDQHAIPFRRLLPSIALSLAGLACISWDAMASGKSSSLLGLLCAFGALVSWTIYAIFNSRLVSRMPAVSSHEWSLLTGVVTGVEALLLVAPAFLMTAALPAAAEWWRFGGIVTAVAIFCSIIGNGLWNFASRVLPMAMMGQMIVFETIFASLYGYLWEQRFPTALEGLAIFLLIAGVISCARVHRSETAI